MSTSVLEILKEARELISKPEYWCQGSMAKLKEDSALDERCAALDPKAERWCAAGALRRAAYEGLEMGHILRPAHVEIAETERVLERLIHSALTAFNDTHTHADVLALFDRAIQQEEQSK